jgi:hypothetical protein
VGVYDIFISHTRADKAWVRRLAAVLADHDYNGRRIRPWLDEHFLDPGALGSESELTTALDRSRVLGLVLSPEAVSSGWVDFELRYFLESRKPDDIVVMLRKDCVPPGVLSAHPVIDFRDDAIAEAPLKQLLGRLCPPTPQRQEDVRQSVDEAFEPVLETDDGYGTASARDAVFAALSRHDIDDPGGEGLAIAAFVRAAEIVRRTRESRFQASYHCKMLLAECLATALLQNGGYRQVARRLLDIAATVPDDPTLLFVVGRAYSKLAEMEMALVDTSVLLRGCSLIDTLPLTNETKAIRALFARVVGKLRDKPPGELLIKVLAEGGSASRVVAAGAIALDYHRSGPVFYLTELERLHERRGEEAVLPAGPPSRRLLGELFALDLYQDESVQRAVRDARDELRQADPRIDFPYGALWSLRRTAIAAGTSHGTPFTGTVVNATLKNMAEVAPDLTASTVACLTELRVVDALFDVCGALLIPEQAIDSPQCRRLRGRNVPFAMAPPEVMAQIADGHHVVVDDKQIRILPQ